MSVVHKERLGAHPSFDRILNLNHTSLWSADQSKLGV